MTTLRITVDEETHKRLAALARERGVSIEMLVAEAALKETLEAEAAEARGMAEQHLARYPELFKRLAE